MMSKANKSNKRKEKLKEKKQKAQTNRLMLSDNLSSALEMLCSPDLPDYIDDSSGIDIVGRKILYKFGQIAWNAALIGETTSDDFMNFGNLAEDEQTIVRDEIARLIKAKNTRWPNFRVRIQNVSIQVHTGKVVIKAKPGEYVPAPKTETRPPEPLTPEAILALRKELSLTQVVFAQKTGVSARVVSAWEHGKSHPSEQQECLIRQMKKEL